MNIKFKNVQDLNTYVRLINGVTELQRERMCKMLTENDIKFSVPNNDNNEHLFLIPETEFHKFKKLRSESTRISRQGKKDLKLVLNTIHLHYKGMLNKL